MLWHAGNAEEEGVYLSVLRKAFSDLGYTEGKNIILEHRFPNEQPERFKALARELVETKVDAIIAVSNLGAFELTKITSSIPIVCVLMSDPEDCAAQLLVAVIFCQPRRSRRCSRQRRKGGQLREGIRFLCLTSLPDQPGRLITHSTDGFYFGTFGKI